MSTDSASLCCFRIYSLPSGDLLIVAVTQNASAPGLFCRIITFFFLLRTLRYKHSLQYPVVWLFGAAFDIMYSSSVTSSLRVSKFHMLSHDTGFLQFLQ